MKSTKSTFIRRKETMTRLLASSALAAGLLIGGASAVQASELLYKPINPSFGGNPFNSAHLLGTADRQNSFREEGGGGGAGGAGGLAGDSAGAQLVRSVERILVNKVSAEIEQDLNDPEFTSNIYEAGGDIIEIVKMGDGFTSITVTNKDSGEAVTTTVSSDYFYQGADSTTTNGGTVPGL